MPAPVAAAAAGGRVAAGRHAAARIRAGSGGKHLARGQAGRDVRQGAEAAGAYAAGKGRKIVSAKAGSRRSGAHRALIVEFMLCTIILALSPLSRTEGETAPKDWMKRGTAISAVFILLGMVSAIGPRAGRTAAAIGGVITLALLVDQRSIFVVVAERLKTTGSGESPQVGPADSAGDDRISEGTKTGQAISERRLR